MEDNNKINREIVIMVIMVIILILSLLGILLYEVYKNTIISTQSQWVLIFCWLYEILVLV